MKVAVLSCIAALLFSGCWLMPYNENFACNSDIGAGSCGMVRDNYNFDIEKNKRK